jgi:DNA processing protein
MTPIDLIACDPCLRRALLVAFLAPRIADLLERPRRRAPGLLRLPDDELIAVAGGPDPGAAHRYLQSLQLDRERERIAASGIGAVCRHAPMYPGGLHDLDDAPAALFVGGRLELLAQLDVRASVAVVGTRRPSPYGIEVAHALGRGLGAAGVTVVSGLALGVDAAAHRGCLAGRGVPVAVLACGPDSAYPRRHRALHGQVGEAGLVVSELPPGAPTFRWAFPARNRLMAALAGMTIVVEAAQPSGSLITVDFARDLGRSVAAVPGRITWRMARGTNALLRDGAVPITGPQDVLDELFGVGRRVVPATEYGSECDPEAERTVEAVLQGVEAGIGIEEIAATTKLSAGAVRAVLGRLEADGAIVRRDLAGWERRAR